MQTDEELIRSFIGGDVKSFEILYNRYKEKLYRFLLYYLNNNQELAEDIFQKTFTKFFEKKDSFAKCKKVNFKSWIFKVAVNIAKDEFKNFYNRNVKIINDKDKNSYKSIQSDIEESIYRDFLKRKIQKEIQRLPEKHRKTIGLYYYSGLSYKEISDILKIPVGTVKSRLNACFKILAKKLKGINL